MAKPGYLGRIAQPLPPGQPWLTARRLPGEPGLRAAAQPPRMEAMAETTAAEPPRRRRRFPAESAAPSTDAWPEAGSIEATSDVPAAQSTAFGAERPLQAEAHLFQGGTPAPSRVSGITRAADVSAGSGLPGEISSVRMAEERANKSAALAPNFASASPLNFRRGTGGEPIRPADGGRHRNAESLQPIAETGNQPSALNRAASDVPNSAAARRATDEVHSPAREQVRMVGQEEAHPRPEPMSSRAEVPRTEPSRPSTDAESVPAQARTAQASTPARIHIGTVEVRTAIRAPEATPAPAAPATRFVPQAPAAPLARSLAWSYGLIQS